MLNAPMASWVRYCVAVYIGLLFAGLGKTPLATANENEFAEWVMIKRSLSNPPARHIVHSSFHSDCVLLELQLEDPIVE